MKGLFLKDINIMSQKVKGIYHDVPPGKEINFDFSETNEDSYSFIYDVYSKKKNDKEVLILGRFNYEDKNQELEKDGSEYKIEIVIECLYEIGENITKPDEINFHKEYNCLLLSFNFLRNAFFNITCLTNGNGLFLPLVSISELQKMRQERKIKEKDKS